LAKLWVGLLSGLKDVDAGSIDQFAIAGDKCLFTVINHALKSLGIKMWVAGIPRGQIAVFDIGRTGRLQLFPDLLFDFFRQRRSVKIGYIVNIDIAGEHFARLFVIDDVVNDLDIFVIAQFIDVFGVFLGSFFKALLYLIAHFFAELVHDVFRWFLGLENPNRTFTALWTANQLVDLVQGLGLDLHRFGQGFAALQQILGLASDWPGMDLDTHVIGDILDGFGRLVRDAAQLDRFA